jgi:hypothetical protein
MNGQRSQLRGVLVVVALLSVVVFVDPRRMRILIVPPGGLRSTWAFTGSYVRSRLYQTFDSDGSPETEAFLFVPVEYIAVPLCAASFGVLGYGLLRQRKTACFRARLLTSSASQKHRPIAGPELDRSGETEGA